jgi:aldehyde dehydrogenase (NAD+)
MPNNLKFYIDGAWVDPVVPNVIEVINPATEQVYARISGGGKADVDKAVAAAKAAFPGFARTVKAERMELLKTILAI